MNQLLIRLNLSTALPCSIFKTTQRDFKMAQGTCVGIFDKILFMNGYLQNVWNSLYAKSVSVLLLLSNFRVSCKLLFKASSTRPNSRYGDSEKASNISFSAAQLQLGRYFFTVWVIANTYLASRRSTIYDTIIKCAFNLIPYFGLLEDLISSNFLEV